MSPMEKMDEIVRALGKLNDGGNWFHTTDEAGGPHTAWRGDGDPDEIAFRALTLARELRAGAVVGTTWKDGDFMCAEPNGRCDASETFVFSPVCEHDPEPELVPGAQFAALLIVSEPTP